MCPKRHHNNNKKKTSNLPLKIWCKIWGPWKQAHHPLKWFKLVRKIVARPLPPPLKKCMLYIILYISYLSVRFDFTNTFWKPLHLCCTSKSSLPNLQYQKKYLMLLGVFCLPTPPPSKPKRKTTHIIHHIHHPGFLLQGHSFEATPCHLCTIGSILTLPIRVHVRCSIRVRGAFPEVDEDQDLNSEVMVRWAGPLGKVRGPLKKIRKNPIDSCSSDLI